MRDNGIERIDLLKIDVEDAEHLVLEGFGEALGTKIDAIQFEYGRVNIITHFLLRDFYQILEARNYLVGKLFSNHVDFRSYDLTDEDFVGPNYVAVLRNPEKYWRATNRASNIDGRVEICRTRQFPIQKTLKS